MTAWEDEMSVQDVKRLITYHAKQASSRRHDLRKKLDAVQSSPNCVSSDKDVRTTVLKRISTALDAEETMIDKLVECFGRLPGRERLLVNDTAPALPEEGTEADLGELVASLISKATNRSERMKLTMDRLSKIRTSCPAAADAIATRNASINSADEELISVLEKRACDRCVS